MPRVSIRPVILGAVEEGLTMLQYKTIRLRMSGKLRWALRHRVRKVIVRIPSAGTPGSFAAPTTTLQFVSPQL